MMIIMNEGFIPEFSAANMMINDVALRVQTSLIALDAYETTLEKVSQLIPSSMIIGCQTRDCEMSWGSAKNALDLIETQKRAKQFILLSGVTTTVNLLDDYMKQLLIKYWDVKPADGDESWFSIEGFELISGAKLQSIQFHEAVDDFRQSADRTRKLRNTRRVNTKDFFDCIVQINEYMKQLGQVAIKKVRDDAAKSGTKLLPPPDPPKFGLGGNGEPNGEGFEGNE